jgi:hypothetical protein
MPDEQEPKGMWNKLWLERTRVLLPLSILISPFLNFLDHHSYDLASVEVVLGLSAIVMVALLFSFMTMVGGRLFRDFVIIGLIMFFVDIQFDLMDEIGKFSKIGIAIGLFTLARLIGDNFHRIATTIFVAVLVVTLVQLPLSKGVTKSRKVWKTPSGSNNPPPRLIHLILDEHIGVEGIPTEMAEGRTLKESLSRFYQRNGFRLFGGAFSRYADTLNSISNTLNFSAENKNLAFVVERENSLSVSRNSLSQNNYFESLAREGYHINVVSSSHLDLCANSTVNLDNCSRYEFGVKSIETMGSPTFRFQLICLSYLNRSYGFRRLRTLVPLPWIQHPHHLSSIQSMNLLDGLWEDILALPRGNVLFVHLMFPHGPFAVRTDCSIKPFGQWKGGRLENPPPYNTAASRKESYQHYFHQLECLYVKLESLFERMRDAGIYDDSIIVLQGDHGSRIVMTYPIPKYRGSLKEQDLMDAYSALFAVKVPGIHGGYDSSPRPLEALLAQFVSEHVASSSLDFTLEQSAFVYLGSDPDLKGKRKGKELMPIPYLIAHH